MNTFRLSLTLLAAFAWITPAAAADPAIKAGFAERDVTPDLGMEQPGGYGKAFHRSLHDPCKVRAAVFDDGKQAVAVVGIDALMIRGVTVRACRAAIKERCGIAEGAAMIAASHSHSSGPTGMILPGEYDDADEFVRKLAYEQSSTADPVYLKRVEQAIVEAVCAAYESRAEAECGFGSGTAEGVAFNRRFRMRNGLTFTHPRQGNPDIVEVAGPTDPQVGVVGAWTKQGKLVGCVVNFACHATTNPGGISANYVYYVERAIRGVFGDDVVVVFTAGAAGDVTQVDNLSPYKSPEAEDWARIVGGRVGAEAARVLLDLPRGTVVPLAAKQKVLQIPRRVPSPARVEKATQLVKSPPPNADATEVTFAKETVLAAARIRKEPVAPVEVQAIQVGPAVFVSNPAEYFCEYGLRIKKESPFPLTFPVSLANDCVGYVPTEEAFGPRGGGYETRLTSYSNLTPSAGRQIADAGIALTRDLTPGPLPERTAHPAFTGGGWSYGSVPPEVE